MPVLFISETHRVVGSHQDDFEALYRDEWMPKVASDPGTRLAWYFNHAHGSSISFNVVTITAAADWEAWGRLQERVAAGDLQELVHRMDQMRYGSVARIQQALDWSLLQTVELAKLPTTAANSHDLTMYIEDTVRPDAGTVADSAKAVRDAHRGLTKSTSPDALTDFAAAFRSVPVAGRRREIVMLQRVRDLGLLATYYTDGKAGAGAPWSARHNTPPFNDTWSTRVLRVAPWSPLA
jgi:hypothetical protein